MGAVLRARKPGHTLRGFPVLTSKATKKRGRGITMNRKSIHWLAAVGWLVTGMIVALLISIKIAPRMHQAAMAAPAAPALKTSPADGPTGAAPAGAARALSRSFVRAPARLKPAVVTIQVEKKQAAFQGSGPLEDFFRRFGGGGPGGRMQMRPQIERGL